MFSQALTSYFSLQWWVPQTWAQHTRVWLEMSTRVGSPPFAPGHALFVKTSIHFWTTSHLSSSFLSTSIPKYFSTNLLVINSPPSLHWYQALLWPRCKTPCCFPQAHSIFPKEASDSFLSMLIFLEKTLNIGNSSQFQICTSHKSTWSLIHSVWFLSGYNS